MSLIVQTSAAICNKQLNINFYFFTILTDFVSRVSFCRVSWRRIFFVNGAAIYLPCGLYYKLITIVIDAASVTLQIVASLTIAIDGAS
jgi:hypothetical protein